MKDYKTVTQEVLQRSEQRRAAIRRRRQTAAVLTAVALVAALGVCAGAHLAPAGHGPGKRCADRPV